MGEGGALVWGRQRPPSPNVPRRPPEPPLSHSGGPLGRREHPPLTTSVPLSCPGKAHRLTKSVQSRAGGHVVRK